MRQTLWSEITSTHASHRPAMSQNQRGMLRAPPRRWPCSSGREKKRRVASRGFMRDLLVRDACCGVRAAALERLRRVLGLLLALRTERAAARILGARTQLLLDAQEL